ncbi:MAG: pyridoxal 5'-phosphate synthase glutaminase subunit PdxT, partial [Terriglobia bacterium]
EEGLPGLKSARGHQYLADGQAGFRRQRVDSLGNITKTAGILALQGDFGLHAEALDRIGAHWRTVKHASELDEVDGLIMPGGESTTMLKFLATEGMEAPIRKFAASGKPILGTCAGAILLAREVQGPAQESLGLLDITVERNAYGRQIDSSVRSGECPALANHPIEMVFIRAPIIRRTGHGVLVLGRAGGWPVLVEQQNLLAATFHPELTGDLTIHRYFLSKMDPSSR